MMQNSLVVVGAIGALWACPSPAQEKPVPVTMLHAAPMDSAGMQISAVGTVRTAPDKITFMLAVVGSGDTIAAARADNEQRIAKLQSALIDAGISASAPKFTTLPILTGGLANMAFDPDDLPPGARVASLPRQQRNMSSVRIMLDGPAKVEQLYKVLASQNLSTMGFPVAELQDDANAHRLAIADAVRKARADGDAYAAAIGYRVVRIAQVSNRMVADKNNDGVSFARMMTNGQAGGVQDVETSAVATLTFLIAPR